MCWGGGLAVWLIVLSWTGPAEYLNQKASPCADRQRD